MASDPQTRELRYAPLKARHREIRETFPPNLDLRVHRALSWLDRAEQAGDDHDAAFIFYWIAFNAAYADELTDRHQDNERSVFDAFFRQLQALDVEHRIYDVIWERFPQAIRQLLHNRYVFAPFWKHHNGESGYADWEERFARSQRRTAKALADQDTRTILSTLFDRLYVLRNQLVHGGATWGSKVNRDQVRDGASIMSFLVPVFIELMMAHPEVSWGEPYYPVVE